MYQPDADVANCSESGAKDTVAPLTPESGIGKVYNGPVAAIPLGDKAGGRQMETWEGADGAIWEN